MPTRDVITHAPMIHGSRTFSLSSRFLGQVSWCLRVLTGRVIHCLYTAVVLPNQHSYPFSFLPSTCHNLPHFCLLGNNVRRSPACWWTSCLSNANTAKARSVRNISWLRPINVPSMTRRSITGLHRTASCPLPFTCSPSNYPFRPTLQ